MHDNLNQETTAGSSAKIVLWKIISQNRIVEVATDQNSHFEAKVYLPLKVTRMHVSECSPNPWVFWHRNS